MENKTEKIPSQFSSNQEQPKSAPEHLGHDFFDPEKSAHEKSIAPDRKKEQPQEHAQEQVLEGEPSASPGPITRAQKTATPLVSPHVRAVESILSEGLEEMYVQLTPEKQSEFRAQGEKTSKEIDSLFVRGKATVQKIHALILQWLRILPGVNRFFLEKEAKIKTNTLFKTYHH